MKKTILDPVNMDTLFTFLKGEGNPNDEKMLLFLDVDGVMNHELFYKKRSKKLSREIHSGGSGETLREYAKRCYDPEMIQTLNDLYDIVPFNVVMTSTHRAGYSISDFNEVFAILGAKFECIGKTPILRVERGCEINWWIRKYLDRTTIFHLDFKDYVILDDDADMLMSQANNFVQIDAYCGITPNSFEKILRVFTGKMFYHP
jgi:hypothetical protein